MHQVGFIMTIDRKKRPNEIFGGEGRHGATAMRTAIMIPMMVPAALMACSDRQVYEGVQKNRQLECQRGPEAQYEECMKGLSESYDSYRVRRKQQPEDLMNATPSGAGFEETK